MHLEKIGNANGANGANQLDNNMVCTDLWYRHNVTNTSPKVPGRL